MLTSRCVRCLIGHQKGDNMALPQDGQNANALATVKEVPIGKKLIFVDPDTNEGGIITLEDLTTQILKKLTSQTFALDQGTKTLPAALNELNSNLPGIEFLTRTITAESEKKEYDLQINATEYMIISIQAEDRMGWQYTVTHGVSGTEATQNWAICFIGNPTGNFTFKIAVLKIK